MKKIFSVIFIGLLCISGCKKENTSSSSNLSSLNSSNVISSNIQSSTSSSSEYISSDNKENGPLYELDTPSLTIDEETGIVEWEEIEGTDYYNYVINDGEILSTTGTLLELTSQSNVSVQAIGNDKYSKWSNAVTFYDTSDIILEGNGKMHRVYFHGTNLKPLEVRDKTKVARPSNPSKVNYVFDNWYADPFYTTLFDFDTLIRESTIIYAHFTPSELVDDVYYWVKANEKITSTIQSSYTSNSGWKFIPLKEDTSSSIKEFTAIITVTNASSTSPAQFLVMDGLDDNSGRTYYKNNGSDFKITQNGLYRITFSVETLYLLDGNQVNAKYELVNYQNVNNANYLDAIQLSTPVVSIDNENNIAYIGKVKNANKYEIIIDNEVSKFIKETKIELNKGSHISVRAIKDDKIFSNWSIPKANINYLYEEKLENEKYAYVYFYESNQDAIYVEKNSEINSVKVEKEGYSFEGWYLDIAKTKKATFPYLVTENTVFYPKWVEASNLLTKEYYELLSNTNNKICGLTWNLDNYDFYEYEAKGVYLAFGESYYIKSLTTSKTWGPYTVSESGSYNIYFSEDHIWDVNTENARNVYFATSIKTLYFSNSKHWSDTIYAYLWNSNSNQNMSSWPGTEMTFLEKNSYGEQIYTIDIDVSKYDMIIFSHGSNNTVVSQTIDISLNEYKDNGFYVTNKNSSGKYEIGTYSR